VQEADAAVSFYLLFELSAVIAELLLITGLLFFLVQAEY